MDLYRGQGNRGVVSIKKVDEVDLYRGQGHRGLASADYSADEVDWDRGQGHAGIAPNGTADAAVAHADVADLPQQPMTGFAEERTVRER